ncbi:MAG: hypothetical protein K9L95_01155 [Candidatus Omnitrophica bacterium]|nr:hypothetical protein [Candidatus Omnitrophota bacterium]MCF7878063.1 hypothetical protein [Candidatus Omnitrophota bacterium]
MKRISLLTLLGAFLILILSAGAQNAACETENFYIYADKNSPKNHFIPSGWMGDTNDLAFNDQATEEALSGGTSIKLTYDPEKGQGQGWAGIYWQSAQNNWGTRDSGYDLSKYNKLVFSAKGAEGGEVITGVKVGGLTTIGSTGEPVPYPDTTNTESGPIRVTDSWQEYQVNLADQDLSYINGGLAIIFNSDHAEEGQSIYIDDIRYSYDPDLTAEDDSTNFPFYVYADSSSLDNHFIPSGWMPATAAKDIRLNTNWKNLPFSGSTCIRVEYENNSGTRWAGIYWQQPANNWGTVPKAGYDLQGAQKLTFWARGDQGGEVIYEFKMGGLSSGQYPDSDSASIGPIELSKEWEKYKIDLRGRDLSYVIGGFAWATNIDVNDPEGIVFYIDEIKYEK